VLGLWVGLGQPTAGLGLWVRGDMTHLGHVTVQGHILGLLKVRVSRTYFYLGNSIGSLLEVLAAIHPYLYYLYQTIIVAMSEITTL